MSSKRRPRSLLLAPEDSYFFLFSCLIAVVGVFANALGPYMRDGSFFLFMAQEIQSGRNPYYATIDSKNPLVEYYWAVVGKFIDLPIELTARVGEGLWILATSFLVYLTISRLSRGRDRLLLSVFLLVGQTALQMPSVTNFGLNISIYQTLPEYLAIILFCDLQVRNISSLRRAFAIIFAGSAMFVGWMVKQTSLVAVGLAFLAVTIGVILQEKKDRRDIFRSIGNLVGVTFICGILVAVFFLYLKLIGTFQTYYDGTFEYNANLAASGITGGQMLNLIFSNVFKFMIFDGAYFVGVLLWVFAISSLIIGTMIWRRKAIDAFTIGVYWWSLGILAQALFKFTFFNHYFLALIFPILILVLQIVNLKSFLTNQVARTATVISVGLVLFNFLLNNGPDFSIKGTVNNGQIVRSKEASSLIPRGAKVFNWSGHMNFFIQRGETSKYRLNQIWYYILTYKWKSGELNSFMRQKFFNDAPDFFIDQEEEYPEQQKMSYFPLTRDLLKEWTGSEYDQIFVHEKEEGIYGLKMKVFKRRDFVSVRGRGY